MLWSMESRAYVYGHKQKTAYASTPCTYFHDPRKLLEGLDMRRISHQPRRGRALCPARQLGALSPARHSGAGYAYTLALILNIHLET